MERLAQNTPDQRISSAIRPVVQRIFTQFNLTLRCESLERQVAQLTFEREEFKKQVMEKTAENRQCRDDHLQLASLWEAEKRELQEECAELKQRNVALQWQKRDTAGALDMARGFYEELKGRWYVRVGRRIDLLFEWFYSRWPAATQIPIR